MSLVTKIKASEGKFAVCVWDPYPRRNMKDPTIVGDGLEEKAAADYAKRMNRKWFEENQNREGLTAEEVSLYQLDPIAAQERQIEQEYFVIDDQGIRVY